MKKNEIIERIDSLEALVPYGASLEIDYDDENDKWDAMYYKKDYECAFNIIEASGKPVIAFEGESHGGFKKDYIEKILYELNVYYVC